MRLFIGAHWAHHIRGWLANLGVYFTQIKKWDIEYTKSFCGNSKHMAQEAAKSDLVILWNGEESCYSAAKEVCREKGIPCYIAEVGYFPQRKFFSLDPKGINASSSLMTDDLFWITEDHMQKMEQRKIALMDGRKRTEGDYIFVPLQVPEDTNVRNYSPFKDMDSFIKHVEEKFKNEKVIFKRHPRDKRSYRSKFPVITEGSSLDYVLGCKRVYGINSTVLLEAALFGVSVEAVGEGFLKMHKDNQQKIIAALVDRQIPYDSTDLDYWLLPVIERAKKCKQERDRKQERVIQQDIKLEIGGGGKVRTGFLQVDIRDLPNVDFKTECWSIPLPDGGVSLIYGRHFFEHLSPKEAEKSLTEWKRLLGSGGQIHMILPNLEFHAKQLLQEGNSPFIKKTNFDHAMAAFYGWEEGAMSHKWGYTKNSLQELLFKNGFENIEFKNTRECDLEVIATVVTKDHLKGELGGHANVTHIDKGSLQFFVNTFKISSMLDVGCGPGGQIKCASDFGINAIGIDGDPEVLRISDLPGRIHICDLRVGPWKGDPVDLVWSVEFLEHIDESYMPHYMETFKLGKWVVCTASQNKNVPYHVNCQSKEYWIEKFDQYGFKFEPELTLRVKQASTMDREFIQDTGMVYSRKED